MSWGETLDRPVGDELADRFARISAELAGVCELLVVADRDQVWLAEGAPHLVQWLTARFGVGPSLGRRLRRLSFRLVELPELLKRFAAGELSLDAVELLAEVATPENELELIYRVQGEDLSGIARICSRERPPSAREAVEGYESQWLSTQWDLHHRRLRMAGELAGEEAQLVEDRLVDTARLIPKNPETDGYDPWEKRMADALVETCATGGDETRLPQLTVHVDLEALVDPVGDGVAETGLGAVIANETARRLGCDAIVEAAVYREDTVVGVGANTRTIPGWLRRQVEYRDHHCQFPGCDRTIWLQVHHRHHRADGGPTQLDNLILLCWYHHKFVHEHGWHITRDPNGRHVFRKPDWTPYPPPLAGVRQP